MNGLNYYGMQNTHTTEEICYDIYRFLCLKMTVVDMSNQVI